MPGHRYPRPSSLPPPPHDHCARRRPRPGRAACEARRPGGGRGRLFVEDINFPPVQRAEGEVAVPVGHRRPLREGRHHPDHDKHVRGRPEIAGDEILTTAILTRLLHHVHIIHIDGRSCRLHVLDGLLKQPASDPPVQGGDIHTA